MADETGISWADMTFNPWIGCQKVGPGCTNCYAETFDNRFGGGHWGPGAPRRRTSAANWKKPIRWNKEAEAEGTRPFVFCSSLADVFDNAVDPAWRADLFELIRATPNLTWLLLTKRPGNIVKLFAESLRITADEHGPIASCWPRNAAIGCTIVNQEEANRDIPKLLDAKIALRPAFAFLSMEPLLGRVDLWPMLHPHMRGGVDIPPVDWVIAGGESGPNARPSHPQWFRYIRDECAKARVPFQFKQWGEWGPYIDGRHMNRAISPEGMTRRDDGSSGFVGEMWMSRVGKKAAGHLLDGVEHLARPEVR